jgi:hypothetical protein
MWSSVVCIGRERSEIGVRRRKVGRRKEREKKFGKILRWHMYRF